MVPALVRLPRPFLAWLITLSNHFPYTSFPDQHKTMDVGEWTDTPFGDYLHGMRYLDTALGELRRALEREGLADTVLVVIGDHDAGFPWEDRIARTAGFTASVAGWLLEDRVPWLILAPGSGVPAGPRATTGGLIDMAPTMLGLLGVDAAPLPFMGRNLLGAPAGDVRVRPHGGWVDGEHVFHGASGRCLSIATQRDAPPERCRQPSEEAARAREISARVVTHGLQADLADAAAP